MNYTQASSKNESSPEYPGYTNIPIVDESKSDSPTRLEEPKVKKSSKELIIYLVKAIGLGQIISLCISGTSKNTKMNYTQASSKNESSPEYPGYTNIPIVDESKSDSPTRLEDPKVKKSSKELIIYLVKAIGLGQIISLCISGTSSLTTSLTNKKNVSIPTSQSFFLYFMLMVVYLSYAMIKNRNDTIDSFKKIWYWYFLLALVDVEGNYFVVKAYEYTSLLHASLLDEWTLPSILICIGGIVILIILDNKSTSSAFTPKNMLKGDIFMIIGATCYAVSNILLEYIVRKRPMFEALGFLGLFGTLINGIQVAALERKELSNIVWDGEVIGYIIGFVLFMFLLYTLVPILLRISSATFLNLSLITADIYILFIGIYAFGYTVSKLYALAFVLIVIGLAIFNISPTVASKQLAKLPGFN
ncbi:hypothetical protein BB561_003487 [Smittium simulii]|uniref:EamA domain-containing protein n=1 Tax=Smittium simulii TaxID=133385 RepID=A0A2T9YL21_9FUNG|nr:hypothetical protein BB561_003487 [Smittium simulii]